jgi:hypothetical protein
MRLGQLGPLAVLSAPCADGMLNHHILPGTQLWLIASSWASPVLELAYSKDRSLFPRKMALCRLIIAKLARNSRASPRSCLIPYGSPQYLSTATVAVARPLAARPRPETACLPVYANRVTPGAVQCRRQRSICMPRHSR